MMPSSHESFDAWQRRPSAATLAPVLEAAQERVYNICFQVLRHRQDAEEAKQEVLLEIASGIGAVEDVAHFERWVGKVAFRTALDRRRKRLRRAAHESKAADRGLTGHAPDDALHEGMSRLDDDDRDLLIERYFDRRTLRELGARYGISAVAIQKRIGKARERLKRMLGCAVPGGFWKSAVTVGAIVMKSKTAAGIAVIVLPFLLLGGGVWVASARKSEKPQATSTTTRKVNPRVAEFLSESKARAAKTADPVPLAGAIVDRVQMRLEIVTRLERLRYVWGRAEECKRLWPEASTEEEGRRLQVEREELLVEGQRLYQGVAELAARDPATMVDLIKTAHELPERRRLPGLIVPEVDAEIGSGEGPSGPLLTGILTLASGDAEDRMHLAAFAGQLMRANRELGQVLLNLMNDPDHNVRMNAASSLCELARTGSLMEFLTEKSTVLRELSELDMSLSDSHTRGFALRTLAALRSDAADDFVIQRFEELRKRSDSVDSMLALSMVAGRVAVRNEARLYAALLRALELPLERDIHYGLRGLAHNLSPSRRDEILRLVELKTPDVAEGPINSSFVVRRGGRGRGLTGVDRMDTDTSR